MPHSDILTLKISAARLKFLRWLTMNTIPVVLIQDIVTSNAGAWLGNATEDNLKNENDLKTKMTSKKYLPPPLLKFFLMTSHLDSHGTTDF